MIRRIGELYRFELYKIIHSKLTVAVILIFAALTIIMGMQLSIGERGLRIHEDIRVLTGHVINNDLINKMNSDIGSVDGLELEENYKYTGLAHTMFMVQDGEDLITADQFYENRIKLQKENMEDQGLSDREMQWWANKEAEISKPITYVPQLNANTLINYMTNICIMAILLAAICLSGVFAGEYRKNMDQILFSCKHGRKETFVAKILAGVSFSVCCVIALTALLIMSVWLRTGLDGLNGAVQLEIPYSAYPFTFIKFIRIQIIIVIIASVMFAAMAMSMSALFKNGIAVMGTIVGLYLLNQFWEIPLKYRVLSQAAKFIPTNLIVSWSLGDFRLINCFGSYHTMFAIAPWIYLVISAAFILIGDLAFKRSQR